MTIAELAAKYEQYVIDMRREFHENPELSHHEERTVRRIREELDKLGIPNITVGHNNVIGTLEGGKPGKKIAIRADIDALPVAEANEVPYKSKVEGVMHACGHDGHAAMLLGTAHVLSEIRDQLCGTVYLCFQVAEEIGAGADEIVAYLKSIGGVDQAIGTHLAGGDPAGVINLPDGPMMAGALGFEITVKGVGGHGSRPDRAVDPVKPACDIVLKIAMIPAQYHNPFDTCVVSPCQITAGNKNNIIPETAFIAGNIRFFKYGDGDKIFAKIKEVAEKNAIRVTTGSLNDLLAYATARVQPPSDKGKRLKIYYMTQVAVKPPTFVIFVNDKELMHFSYTRYLENKIRDAFGFSGTSLKFIIRERGEKE